MLSTLDSDVMIDTTNAQSAHHSHEIMKPQSVLTYNKSTAGVDKHDQMASYYPLKRKPIKWWKKLFFWSFQMGLVNAYKLYKLSNPSDSISFLKYMMTIAKTLPTLRDGSDDPAAANEPQRFMDGDHFPLRIRPTEGKAKPTRRCIHCSSKPGPDGKKPRKETSWLCQECQVPLCIECFKSYHRPHSRV